MARVLIVEDTPVIVITAIVDPELLKNARDAGAADTILKPWYDGQIEAAVGKAIAGQ
jgi:FixJ family two-component response regulator